MSYIDKIKKNGVIYQIRGTGSSASSEPSESIAAVGSNLVYEPAENEHYQMLDTIYNRGQVNTITWNDITYHLLKVNSEYNYSLFISDAVKDDVSNAHMPVICLLHGIMLIDYVESIAADSQNSNTLSSNFGENLNSALAAIEPKMKKLMKINVPDELKSYVFGNNYEQFLAGAEEGEITGFDRAVLFNFITELNGDVNDVINDVDSTFNILQSSQMALMFVGIMYQAPVEQEA